MRSGNYTKSVILGVFIAVGLLLFILAVLALSGQQKPFSKTIVVKTVFDDVSGLKAGNNILYAGVKVGVVKKITLLPQSKVQVELEIDDDKKQFIPHDAIAKLGSEGFIGSKLITLSGGTNNNQSIADGGVLKSEAVITQNDLLNTLQVNNKNLVDITTDIKQLSRKVLNGEGSVGKLIKDNTMYDGLQQAINSINKTSLKAQNLTNDLTSYTSKLQKPGTFSNDLITDTVLFARLRATTRRIDEISLTSKLMINKLSTSADNLTNSSTPAGLMLNDTKTTESIKVILQNLQLATHKLNEDLEAIQNSFLLRGYFRRKSKEDSKKEE